MTHRDGVKAVRRSTTVGASTPGRASRTALYAFLAADFGARLLANPSDPVLTIIPFVLVVLATSALTAELTAQAHRGRSEPADRWARTDTANVAVLALFAALLGAAVGLGGAPAYERTAAGCFAVLYLLLAGYFWRARRRSLADA